MINNLTHTMLCLLLFICCACSPQHAPNATHVEWNKHLAPGHQVVVVNGVRMEPYQERIPGTDIVIDMIPVPGGEFLMGSPPNEKHREDSEGPQVRVKVDPFWISKYEITWEQFDEYLKLHLVALQQKPRINSSIMLSDAVTVPSPKYDEYYIHNMTKMKIGKNHPVSYISQLSAKQFSKWVSKFSGRFYRLPSEAEWEYAARAGTKTVYSWGDDASEIDRYAWYFDNTELDSGWVAPQPVGLKQPNPWGLHDMHGNVSEWVLDEFEPAHYQQFKSGQTYHWKQLIKWQTGRFNRVHRGGNYDSAPMDVRSAIRMHSTEDLWVMDPAKSKSLWWVPDGPGIGFRLIRPLHVPEEDLRLQYWQIFDQASQDAYKVNSHAVQVRIEPPK